MATQDRLLRERSFCGTGGNPIDDELARSQLLDAAGRLFYARGIQAVGMDEIRNVSGISLKRLYRLFPSKDHLLDAFLERRDAVWRSSLATFVEQRSSPEDRLLAVFDWLENWFNETGFRGCVWINSYGELGSQSAAVASRTRDHKSALMEYLSGLVADDGLPADLAQQIYLLIEGAIVTAAITETSAPAVTAKRTTTALISLARDRMAPIG